MAGIKAFIPKRGQVQNSTLGATRWPIERTISWLKQFRRVRIRGDRLDEVHQAFHDIANSLIAWRFLPAE
ncbi:transposase [Planctomicrobium sp. SH664]|uniref:transposase n=1 Tax=Planctomicrobium sp. SH664 TaxID=3448125 RepID=UPI003F5C4CCF